MARTRAEPLGPKARPKREETNYIDIPHCHLEKEKTLLNTWDVLKELHSPSRTLPYLHHLYNQCLLSSPISSMLIFPLQAIIWKSHKYKAVTLVSNGCRILIEEWCFIMNLFEGLQVKFDTPVPIIQMRTPWRIIQQHQIEIDTLHSENDFLPNKQQMVQTVYKVPSE